MTDSVHLNWAENNTTDLSVAGHLYASIQELIKILAELSRSYCQLAARPSGGMDHLARWLVQVCGCLVQFILDLLERLVSWWDLKRKQDKLKLHNYLSPLSKEQKANSQFQSAASCWPLRCFWEPCPRPSVQGDSWRSCSGSERQPWPPGQQGSFTAAWAQSVWIGSQMNK